MASGYLSKPGTEYGPCGAEVLSCAHHDCAATRITAAEVCRLCQDVIGYERDFYVDPDMSNGIRFVHASCLE